MGSGAALGQLPVHHAGQDVGPHGHPEHRLVEVDAADRLVFQADDVALHGRLFLFLAGIAGSRSFGRSRFAGHRCGSPYTGRERHVGRCRSFAASRMSRKPPSQPGTPPFTMIRPRSGSVATTLRFWVVTPWRRPGVPAIFLPLRTAPGALVLWPVEPRLRWLDRHAVRRPQGRQSPVASFQTAGKALAHSEVPVTSTYWPDDEMVGRQTRRRHRRRHQRRNAELDDMPLGLDLRFGKMAPLSLGDVLHLGRGAAELHGVVAVVFVSVRWAMTWQPSN